MFTNCQVIIKLIIYINFIFPTNYNYNDQPTPFTLLCVTLYAKLHPMPTRNVLRRSHYYKIYPGLG